MPSRFLLSPSRGRSGYALSFNGTSDFASAPLKTFGARYLTVSYWLNWTTFANNDKLAMEYSANYNSNIGGFISDPNSSGPHSGSWDFATNWGVTASSSGITRPSAGVWHHIAVVMDAGNIASGFAATNVPYVDGSRPTATTGTGSNQGVFGDYTLYLMSRAGASLFGAGAMADLAMWREPLNQGEVALLASGADPRFVRAGPLYYWTLGELHPEASLGLASAIMTPSGGALVPGPALLRQDQQFPYQVQELHGAGGPNVIVDLPTAVESTIVGLADAPTEIEIGGGSASGSDILAPIELGIVTGTDSKLPFESMQGNVTVTTMAHAPLESAAMPTVGQSSPIEFDSKLPIDVPAPIEVAPGITVTANALGPVEFLVVPHNFAGIQHLPIEETGPPILQISKLGSAVVLSPPTASLAVPKIGSAAVIYPRIVPPPAPLCAGIFPDNLPGVTWSVHREPIYQSRVQRAVDGYELRVLDYPWPLRRWTLIFEFLRDDRDLRGLPGGAVARLPELRTLVGFYGWAQGAYRCFCYLDPEDDYATGAQMLMLNSWAPAVGDGATTDFQLARPVPPSGALEPITAVYSLDAVYFNGFAAQLSGATWSVSDGQNGVVSFADPPGVGVVITADFAYYWRVRFQDDNLPFENFMLRLWTQRKLQLIQCLPPAIVIT